eukprot:comp5504_c0_seq1/m.1439 comp5504_c0_seq1/g.1439  ORF comp5504_c0_seq1/g.1439 comp5504_c0_seq1/m.1439 type:complete len:338 (-) comp5504_c0_seq1:456-1469(-)
MKYKTRKEAMDALGPVLNESLNGPISTMLGRDLLDKQVNTIISMQHRRLVGVPLLSLIGSGPLVLIYVILLRWYDTTGLAWRATHAASLMLCLSGVAKIIAQGPRPYWLSDKIKTLDPTLETSYGFPSGHTTSGVCVFGIMAWHFNKPWLWVAYALFAISLAYSRVYTGAHFIHDVIGGFFVGGTILLLDIFSEVVMNHYPGTPGSYFEATYCLGVAGITFLFVMYSAGTSGRVKPMMVYEAVSGCGFTIGLAIAHIFEMYYPPPCAEQPPGPVPAVLGLLVIVVIDKLTKRLPEYPDHTQDLWSVIVAILSFALIQFWANWALPRLATTCVITPSP